MKEKLKSASLWLAIAGGVILLLQAFGMKIDVPMANEALSAVSGLLILLGILKKSDGGEPPADNPETEDDGKELIK
ncbi:MAG: hypothetical protein LBT30_04160 [Clostridiales bacterium]|jgi:uncharacterized membrane protein|nr:hypothetical protein [Clostridiales bacterium]